MLACMHRFLCFCWSDEIKGFITYFRATGLESWKRNLIWSHFLITTGRFRTLKFGDLAHYGDNGLQKGHQSQKLGRANLVEANGKAGWVGLGLGVVDQLQGGGGCGRSFCAPSGVLGGDSRCTEVNDGGQVGKISWEWYAAWNAAVFF